MCIRDSHYIARWEGDSWSPLGSGMSHRVNALVVDGAGHLYAGGDFNTAGGISANHIAWWDGAAWSPLGAGMDASVRALAVDDAGNVYAGGQFTMAGGVSAKHVARWNGVAWSALGSGMTGCPTNQPCVVNALVTDDTGGLYAGGYFVTAGEVSANSIAHWNGAAWSALGSGISQDGYVYALAMDSAVPHRWGRILGGRWDQREPDRPLGWRSLVALGQRHE